MNLRTPNFRRFVVSLAMITSLMGSLQQCHAFCAMTECETACGPEKCSACQAKKSCCHSHDHGVVSKIESVCCHHLMTQHEPTPCQDHCWCCRQSEPSRVPSDETSRAKEILASSTFMLVTCITEILPIQASISDGCQFLDSHALAEVDVCIDLCRFRI